MNYFGTYNRLGLNVSATPKEVLRAFYKKLKPSARQRKHREHRHFMARIVLMHHCDARTFFIKHRF